MDNETQIKAIISSFIHKEAADITTNTVIDRSAVRSSIHVHRLHAALAEAGLVVANPNSIRTFGDLLQATGNKADLVSAAGSPAMLEVADSDAPFIGIDIEQVSNFNAVTDYRVDEFYKQNFSASEIAWCILQSQPLASFAGKFAAKEAIVKADNGYASLPFHRIEILNTSSGKPQFKGFQLSISHTESTAVAVAIKGRGVVTDERPDRDEAPERDKLLWLLVFASFLLALVALLKG